MAKNHRVKVIRPPEKFKDCRDSMPKRYQERPGCPCDRCVRKEHALVHRKEELDGLGQ